VTTPVETVAPETHAGDRVHGARMSNGRLEFLDALRGIAALVVAIQHTSEVIWPQVVAFSHIWWRPGEFGVLVFFICSGFIIPASMERRGNLAEFWIGRAFRLFPLYLAVVGLGLVAFATPWAAPGPGYRVVSDSLINTTMLQVFSGRPLVIGASWTLGYEMVFYLLMTVLFMLGWHRRSAGIAVGLVTAALVGGGFLVPAFLQQPQIRQWPAVVIGLVALAVAVIAPRLAGRQRVIALTITVVVLMLFLNRPHDLWFCYQVGAPEPMTGATPRWWTEAGTFVSAYLVFGALFLLRNHAFPRVLVYLGTISYSVYLMHALVLLLPNPPLPDVSAFAVLIVATLTLSAVTYHFIEKPGQMLGRRMIALYRKRTGGSAAQVPPAQPTGEPPAEQRAGDAQEPEDADLTAEHTPSIARR
jgi:peptidoglycan/LPS O-acetylase OafA/YrhL